jgi:predicted PurR-regulated permease PerM
MNSVRRLDRTQTVTWNRACALSLVVLATLASVAAIVAARAMLWPLVLAAFFALLLTTPVEALHRRRVPRTLAALVVVTLVTVALGAAVNATWEPGRQWVQAAPENLKAIEARMTPLQHTTAQIDAWAARLESLATATRARSAPAAPPGSLSASLMATAPTVAVDLLTVFVTTLFLLVSGPRLLGSWITNTHPGATQSRLLLVDAVRRELSKYFGSIALINIGLGAATAGLMTAFNVPNPILWGSAAAILNFVPYVGPLVTLTLLAATCLITFPTLTPTLEVLGAFLLLVTIEGQVIEPFFVGRRLRVSPLIVLLAVWVGACLWGVAGVVLAMPVVIAAKAGVTHRLGDNGTRASPAPTGTPGIPGRRVPAKARSQILLHR